MKTLRLSYRNMWPDHLATGGVCDDFFYFALRQHYNVILDDQNPDLVIHSVFGQTITRDQFWGDPVLVGYSGESQDVQGDCDVKFGFHKHGGPQYHRLPLWCLYIDWDKSIVNTNPLHINNLLSRHQRAAVIADRFCNFTYRNPVRDRVEFFLKLNVVNRVDSTGPLYNNTGYLLQNKARELNKWKFTIAWENVVMPGYVTEKILEPLAAGSIPIYQGGALAQQDFNPDSFISVSGWLDQNELARHLYCLSQDHAELTRLLSQPIFSHEPEWPSWAFEKIYNKLVENKPRLAL